MKKKLIVTIALASVLAGNVNAAGVSSSAHIRAQLTEYTKTVKTSFFNGSLTAKGLSGQAKNFASNKSIEDLGLDGATKSGIKDSLTVTTNNNAEAVERNYESLVSVVAAKKLAAEAMKSPEHQEEGKSLDRAASAALKAMADGALIGARSEAPGFLNKSEMADVGAALRKELQIMESIMKMDGPERDSWTQIIEKRTELSVRMSPEEAYIRSIMEVKKISREDAIALVKKVIDCAA